jgi:hypothetical protein
VIADEDVALSGLAFFSGVSVEEVTGEFRISSDSNSP